MLTLSTEEQDAILRLGSDSDVEVIAAAVLQKLMDRRLICRRSSDGHLDLTDAGIALYDVLIADRAGQGNNV